MSKEDIGRRSFLRRVLVAGAGVIFGGEAFGRLYPFVSTLPAFAATDPFVGKDGSYPIVDTGQTNCYDDAGTVIECPSPGRAFYGQDAQYRGCQPTYRDNGNGTVTDLNTGLMWVKARGSKVSWDEAKAGAASCAVGGYHDWRMPTIKELYSLINFNGGAGRSAEESTPYIDTRYFDFRYGDELSGERLIDCQDWSATEYVSVTMGGNPTAFGVNFADGRIKGYPKVAPGPRTMGRDNTPGHPEGTTHRIYVRYVRGNPAYGVNRLSDNGDGTVTDHATNLMWSRADSGTGMNWEEALAWVGTRNREAYLGYTDWRLPNAKELQSIVDYTRSPDTTGSAAIDPVFRVTSIVNEGGMVDYPYFWTSTTHLDGPPDIRGKAAVYVAFGRALGYMEMPPGSRNFRLTDVHGAGAQRSDPKRGDPADFPRGRGPQGDVIRIYNFVHCVRDATA